MAEDSLHAAGATVDAWIERCAARGWATRHDVAWSDKDLLGHLAAWSDLLMDQVEVLCEARPGSIAAVDVDAWNARQVAARTPVPVENIIEEWRRSFARVLAIVANLPHDVRRRAARVAWAQAPVTIDEVLMVWLRHIEAHRSRFDE